MALTGQFAKLPALMLRQIEPEASDWDDFVARQPRAHILQTAAWGELKSLSGWRPARVALADEQDEIVAGAQLLLRRMPALPYTIAYLARGPFGEQRAGAELWPAIHERARAHGAALLKWEPEDEISDEFSPPRGFRAGAATIQPPRTIVLDIRPSEAEIIARMNQGTRRKIRRGLRELQFREGTSADIPAFYALLAETARRNRFGIHSLHYYQRAAALFFPGRAALLLAEKEGQMLSGVMVFALAGRAWYFYGASSSAKEARKYSAGYGAQWAAIRWARARGCREYDLWGIPDEEQAQLEAQFPQRSDGLWGVFGFKRGWGGKVVRRAGALDLTYRPFISAIFRSAVALRQRWSRR